MGIRVFLIFHYVQTFFSMVGGEVTGSFQKSGAQPKVTILHRGGLSSSRRTQRYCQVYSLRRNQSPALFLYYNFLIAPLFLPSLIFLFSNCLNLPFGTQGRSRRLKSLYNKQKKQGHRKDLYPSQGSNLGSLSTNAKQIYGDRVWRRQKRVALLFLPGKRETQQTSA